ncbi:tRNA pseudouridine synthase-like 1 isoform X2 [Sarcophilus harrisii]|uniref:tRNA pseudouridine synthase-like 1 isoform X2 n=1 Tax=Sarcophilus harrisii TaxID=9305 RepID=UPI001301F53C|nr:tRNA pseudouridine synthase-like 1 isoform X2 [Sarcophilus harrisii]
MARGGLGVRARPARALREGGVRRAGGGHARRAGPPPPTRPWTRPARATSCSSSTWARALVGSWLSNGRNRGSESRISSRVIRAFRAPDDFHARFDATSRTYLYRVVTGRSLDALSVFDRNLCWAVRTDHLDVAAMQEAARHLQGTHDFRAFRSVSDNDWKNPVRTLLRASVAPASASPFTHPQEKRKLQFWDLEFESKSFLYKQVRRMTACLVAVGLGALTPAQVKEKLESGDPQSGPSLLVAPAQGLFLKSVHYEGLDWGPGKDWYNRPSVPGGCGPGAVPEAPRL